jgi:hypothetical protein
MLNNVRTDIKLWRDAWIDSTRLEEGPMAGSCEHINQSSESIKGWECFE